MADQNNSAVEQVVPQTPVLRKKWSYPGLDPDGTVPSTALDHNTCQPALIVWLTLTTNLSYQGQDSTPSEDDIEALSDACGLTVSCIRAIRAMAVTPIAADDNGAALSAEDVQAAFFNVARAFHNIGANLVGQEQAEEGDPDDNSYLPDNCPLIGDMADIAKAAGNAPNIPAPPAPAQS